MRSVSAESNTRDPGSRRPRACSWRLMTLNVSVRGSVEPTRTTTATAWGRGRSARRETRGTPSGSNVGAVGQHQRRHHLIADIGRRDPVHRHLDDIGVAQQHPLDRRRAEVLTVDPHPVAEPAGEVGKVVLVAVGQVAAVVHATAHPLGVGVRVVVVALETACVRDVYQLAGHARRARLAALDVDDLGSVGQRAQRSRWGVRRAADRDTALGRTESVHHQRVEPCWRTSRRRRVRPRCRRPPAAGCPRRRAAPGVASTYDNGLPT